MTATYGNVGTMAQSVGKIFLGPTNGIDKLISKRKISRYRRRERTSGSMCVSRRNTTGREFQWLNQTGSE